MPLPCDQYNTIPPLAQRASKKLKVVHALSGKCVPPARQASGSGSSHAVPEAAGTTALNVAPEMQGVILLAGSPEPAAVGNSYRKAHAFPSKVLCQFRWESWI